MKNKNQALTLLVGEGNELTRDVCQVLAKEGISAIVREKTQTSHSADEHIRQLSGEPGKDLFFNGWKLLF